MGVGKGGEKDRKECGDGAGGVPRWLKFCNEAWFFSDKLMTKGEFLTTVRTVNVLPRLVTFSSVIDPWVRSSRAMDWKSCPTTSAATCSPPKSIIYFTGSNTLDLRNGNSSCG